MAYANLKELLSATCDAIRLKEGSKGLINHQDIPNRIEGLNNLETTSLSDIHIWKKSTATEEFTINESEGTDVRISYYSSTSSNAWDEVSYADEIEVIDGELSLVNPTTITLNSSADGDALKGKYIYTTHNEKYYRIPSDATLTYKSGTYYAEIDASTAMKLSVSTSAIEGDELIGYVVTTDKTAYPEDGNTSEGFRYVYIGTAASVGTVETVDQGTPTISVSSAGLITASVTQTAGYVEAGTKSATKQLTTQAAKTYTPGTSSQTIASGKYLSGVQTIEGDSNLVASNIKSGVSIFGVAGSYAGENTNGSSGGLAVRSGEVIDSTVIETGLSSVSYFMLYKTSFAETGLLQAAYGNEEDATAFAFTCVNYSNYVISCGIAKPKPIIEGGKITWPWESTSTSGMSSGKTYKWVAFGEE